MFNILLDPLPYEWNGYEVDMDFQTGIQISQCLSDDDLTGSEKMTTVLELMFPKEKPDTLEEIEEVIAWYVNGWNTDNVANNKKNTEVVLMDFDIDQWRIYAAFRKQYGINLNRQRLHFWEYMGLLVNLEECVFTQVISIRDKKIDSKMSKEEKAMIIKAKKMYAIKKEVAESEEEKAMREAAIDEFNKLRAKSR